MATTSHDDAVTEIRELRAEIRELRALMMVPAAPAGPTFGDFAKAWLDRQEATGRLRPNTLKSYNDHLRVHCSPMFGDLPVAAITVQLVDEFVAAQVAAGAAPRSVNARLAFLTSVLEAALEYDLIARNPAQGRNRRIKQPTPKRVWIGRVDQIEALVIAAAGADRLRRSPRAGDVEPTVSVPDHTGARQRALTATLLFAGLRIGEALALRWTDVDFDGSISVRAAKTDAGVRTVDMLPVLRAELLQYVGWDRAHAGSDGYVFPTLRGRANTRQYVGKRLAVAVEDANRMLAAAGRPLLPEGITPHALRRTFASILFDLGESVPYIVQQMGHSGPGITLSAYARPLDRSTRDALRELVSRSAPIGRMAHA
jgi:integrase